LAIFLPFLKAGGRKQQRCQGLAVDDYGGTFGASTLKPSGFCNIGLIFIIAINKQNIYRIN
jgi:hypothetical protein